MDAEERRRREAEAMRLEEAKRREEQRAAQEAELLRQQQMQAEMMRQQQAAQGPQGMSGGVSPTMPPMSSGGEASGGSAMGQYVAPAAAMAALVTVGEKSGANKEMKRGIDSIAQEIGRLPENSKNFPRKLGRELKRIPENWEERLKFWEMF